MTHLRRIMLEELQRRHYSQATTQRYIRFVERFAQHFHCSPDRLGLQHIREYQAQLFTVQQLSPGTVTNHLCALRFFASTALRSFVQSTSTREFERTQIFIEAAHAVQEVLKPRVGAQAVPISCRGEMRQGTLSSRERLVAMKRTPPTSAELTRRAW